MPNPATLATAEPTQRSADAPVIRNPFVRAASQSRQPFHDKTTAIGSSAVRVGPIDVAAMGYMRALVLYVETDGTGAGGSAVAAADAPWNVLDSISLEDVNGRPIVGPLSGYDLYLINKWGAYTSGEYDPANLPSYTAVSSNGEFAFKLRIPVELTERDALGSLPNLTASATYKLHYTVAAESTVYGTAPATTTPGVRVKATLEAWSQPRPTDARGLPNETTPPAMGTTQFWSKSTVNVSAGEQRIAFKRMGNLIRNIIMVYRDDSSPAARTTGEFPDTFRIEWDNKILDTFDKELWGDQMRERYGQNQDTGVFVYDLTHDADGRPGNENRHLYLPTVSGTRLEFIGSFSGSGGVLTILTNDVAPAGGAPLASGMAAN